MSGKRDYIKANEIENNKKVKNDGSFIPIDVTPEELGIISYAYDMTKGIARIDIPLYVSKSNVQKDVSADRELTEAEKSEISRKVDELLGKERTKLSELTDDKFCNKINV